MQDLISNIEYSNRGKRAKSPFIPIDDYVNISEEELKKVLDKIFSESNKEEIEKLIDKIIEIPN